MPSLKNRQTYETHLVDIKNSTELVAVASMESSVTEICDLHENATDEHGNIDCTAMFDGT